jgi:cytochrome c oxidase cbb3-type subunit 3
MNPPRKLNRDEVVLREHSFDGIQEYDQRLPNWWLYTLFGAVGFSMLAWLFFTTDHGAEADMMRLTRQMDELDAKRFAAIKDLDDKNLWAMSRNQSFVAQGEKVFQSICYTCHGVNLQGGIGFRLGDNLWVHGTKPMEIFGVVTKGVPGTGMQSWNAQLGPAKITQVVAFLLSKQDPNNMILIPRDQEPTLQHKSAP